jgi:hypothetical protein
MYDVQLTLSSRKFSKWSWKCSGSPCHRVYLNKCLIAHLTSYGGRNRDMTERGWSISKWVLPAPNHSRPLVRWACHQEISSTPLAPSRHYCSKISRTRTNSSKALVCTYKKISTSCVPTNKFTDGVKFVVKIIPSDGLVIGVGRQLLKMLSQTRETDIECWEPNVLVLFPSVPYLKWPWIIGDVVITIWIGIQPKEHLQRPALFIVSHLCYWFSCIFHIWKSDY